MKIQITRDAKGYAIWPGATSLHLDPGAQGKCEWFDDACKVRGETMPPDVVTDILKLMLEPGERAILSVTVV